MFNRWMQCDVDFHLNIKAKTRHRASRTLYGWYGWVKRANNFGWVVVQFFWSEIVSVRDVYFTLCDLQKNSSVYL